MILDTVKSINDVLIRLTDERWYEHILVDHPYMSGYYQAVLDAIYYPEFILRGQKGAKIAILNVGRDRWLRVLYREINKNDGFIITAYIADEFDENLIIWKRDN
jgi:hypothetical protein